MNVEEKLKDIKERFNQSNRYVMSVGYEDIEFLLYIIDTLDKRLKFNDKQKYVELKDNIKKNILDEIELLTRNPNVNDFERIEKLSMSYNYLKEE